MAVPWASLSALNPAMPKLTAMRNERRLWSAIALLAVHVAWLGGCSTPVQGDPYETLNKSSLTGSSHLDAIQAVSMDDPGAKKALENVMWKEGYTVEVRTAAFEKLAAADPDFTK